MTKLTVQNAQITTATVEIKTLTISGKQVTLAVFRQLREERLIAEDGTLNGVPWGTVNYHPDKHYSHTDKHWHVIWQRGADLCRDTVEVSHSFYGWRSDLLDVFYSLACAAQVRGEPVEKWFGGKPVADSERYDSTWRWQGKHCGLEAYATAADYVRRAGRFIAEDADLSEMNEKIREITGPGTIPEAMEKLWGRVEEEGLREADRRQRHVDVRKAIADLPQLFIAV